jgi:CheY-like chemotaxis protein
MTEYDEQQRASSEEVNRRLLHEAIAARQLAPVGTAWEPRALRVLVVDDDRDTADSISHLIRLWGHQVRRVDNTQAGVREAVEFRPDFLLMDLAMPLMDGIDMARQLRLDPQMRGCSIIAVTGFGSEEQRSRCREAGMDLVLVKPIDPEILEELLSLQRTSP